MVDAKQNEKRKWEEGKEVDGGRVRGRRVGAKIRRSKPTNPQTAAMKNTEHHRLWPRISPTSRTASTARVGTHRRGDRREATVIKAPNPEATRTEITATNLVQLARARSKLSTARGEYKPRQSKMRARGGCKRNEIINEVRIREKGAGN
ncbi:hypothetical protein BDN71DRAFT_145773 [Pleurotus eryngii]|uniref:Uncharacterized protein n=1 Tax=Pleurotus eryngii TaxID=5323 RepID=A0A9P5ZPG8_PLEER|nr:hypothetical protein BDN71DRAFT_145773 [Pleurotus eryngii]